MAIVLPMLKLALALQSSWEAYKVLKPPRSQSLRALAARKRNMKAVLSVWVVWAFVSIIEPPLDSTVGVVLPFYGETKNVVFLALLVFKSFIAEPIVLRIIRPYLRPYQKHIDGLVDLATLLGTLFTGALWRLLSIPLQACSRMWRQWDESPLFGVRVRALSAVSGQQAGSSDEDDSSPTATTQESTSGSASSSLRGRSRRQQYNDAHRAAEPVLADIDTAILRHRESRETAQQHFGNYTNNIQLRARPRANSRAEPAPVARPPSRQSQVQRSSSGTQPASSLRQPSRSSSGSQSAISSAAPPAGSTSTQTAFIYPNLAAAPESKNTYGRRTSLPTSPPPPYTSPAIDRSAYGASAVAAAGIAAARRSRSPSFSGVASRNNSSSNIRLVGVVPDTPARFPGALPLDFDGPPSMITVSDDDDDDEMDESVEAARPAGPVKVGDGFVAQGDMEIEFVGRSSRITRASSVRDVPQPHLAASRSAFPATLASTYATSSTYAPPKRANSTRKRVHEPDATVIDAREQEGDSDLSDTASDTSSIVKKRKMAGGRVARKIALIEEEQTMVPSSDSVDELQQRARSGKSKSKAAAAPALGRSASVRVGTSKAAEGKKEASSSSNAGAGRPPSRSATLSSTQTRSTRSRTTETRR